MKNGLEGKIGKTLVRLDRFISEQQAMNRRFENADKDLRKILKEELKLKAVMFAWLKDHHVRLNHHWNEIFRRTVI